MTIAHDKTDRAMAFAHGKVLLFGEHAVVYGEPAIAAGLQIGVRARAASAACARLRCSDWDLDVAPADGTRVGAAFAALIAALPGPAARVVVDVFPELPAGAGLGSSAALAVSVARAIAGETGLVLSDDDLFAAALASERVFHGNPSGLDHTVAVMGGLLRFERGTPPAITALSTPNPVSFLVAQVAAGADTGAMVAGVRAQRDRLGAAAEGLHRQIGVVCRSAEEALRHGDLAQLGELMNINHGLLMSIGVSTAALDQACAVARAAGALGAKLTGAGGGGCIVALVDPRCEAAVTGALDACSLGVYPARVG